MTPAMRKMLSTKRAKVSHLILHEMGLRGYTCESLGRKIGCSGANIHRAIHGVHHSITVLTALRDIGVPEKYLYDPHAVQRGETER
jgi:hypothetical protein